MKELTDKLAAIGAPISEEDKVVTLLGSLPKSYSRSALVTALEARERVSLSYVQQSLIHEEQKLNGEQALDSKMNAGHNTSALVGQLKGLRSQNAITVVRLDILFEAVQRSRKVMVQRHNTKLGQLK